MQKKLLSICGLQLHRLKKSNYIGKFILNTAYFFYCGINAITFRIYTITEKKKFYNPDVKKILFTYPMRTMIDIFRACMNYMRTFSHKKCAVQF